MMDRFSHEDRLTALRRMAAEGVDILVIGGGITGAGVALDAAARGYRTGLVEKGDFASGTSSKSTKLVHGGIRYLPQFDFALVREALVERGLLIQNAPFLVKLIGFVLPFYAENKRPLGTPIVPPFGIGMKYLLRVGLLMYDLLAGRLGVRRYRHLSKDEALKLVPCLRTDSLKDVFEYYDAQTDDTLLTLTVLRTAAQQGAYISNYAEVIGFEMQNGRIAAAQVRDKSSSEMFTIRAGTVINAAGVFAGRIEAMANGRSQVKVEPAKGTHITVAREAVKLTTEAVVLPETEDGRVMFLVPWGPRVTIGTTDTEGGDIDNPKPTRDDVTYLLRHINRYLNCNLSEKDVISAWAGYRPLVSTNNPDRPYSKLSRTHVVLDSSGGMVTIVGGKLTTYRRMAQDTLDHVDKQQGKPSKHMTRNLSLVGSSDAQTIAKLLENAATTYKLRADSIDRLHSYGGSASLILRLIDDDPTLSARIIEDLQYIMAEVVFACRFEMALHLEDVLERRLHIAFEDRGHGAEAAAAVAATMGLELQWTAQEIQHEVDGYRETARSRYFL
jgi:glycerol-3-phosphate dehydrogenase